MMWDVGSNVGRACKIHHTNAYMNEANYLIIKFNLF